MVTLYVGGMAVSWAEAALEAAGLVGVIEFRDAAGNVIAGSTTDVQPD
ncbi:hypothetical protein J0H58_05865 [bacterium]|nr:hypothetical protein [bacterium]